MAVEPPRPAAPLPRPAALSTRRGLDPMWIGAVALVLLSLAVADLVGYAVLEVPFLRSLGGWSIVIGSSLAISIVVPLRLWTTSAHKA
jgi:hypothetical protein